MPFFIYTIDFQMKARDKGLLISSIFYTTHILSGLLFPLQTQNLA